MSEPSSGVPREIADQDVDDQATDAPEKVELDVDEDKLEAWDDVKGDYEVNPGGEPVPNSMDDPGSAARDDDGDDDGDDARDEDGGEGDDQR